jgi:hypothetical protein
MSDQKTDIRVWVRVQVVGEANLSSATSVKVEADADVDDLRKAVKKKKPNALKHCDSVDLIVYRNATDYNNRAGGRAVPLAADAKLSGSKSLKDAYIVVVPDALKPRSILRDGLPKLTKSASSPTDAHKNEKHGAATFTEKPFYDTLLYTVHPAEGTAVYGSLGKLPHFWYRSEADVAGFCVAVMREVLQALRLDENSRVIVMSECVLLNWRGDIWLVLGQDHMPLLVIDVKKPKGDKDLKNEELAGQLFDYLSEIKHFTGLQHVFGIAASYDRWRIVWLPSPETDTLASEAKLAGVDAEAPTYDVERPRETAMWNVENLEEEAKEEEKGEVKLNFPRLLHCSRLYDFDDPRLVPALMNVVMKAMSSGIQPVPLVSLDRAYLAINKTSVTWSRLPRKFRGINYAKMPQKTCENFLLVCKLGGGSSGRVWFAVSASGSCCVIKRPRLDVLDDKQFEEFEAALEYECSVWKKFFCEHVRTVVLGGVPALVMPFARPLTSEEWKDEAILSEVKATLKGLVQQGFVHGDMKRDHVGVYVQNNTRKYCFFDAMKSDGSAQDLSSLMEALSL